MTDEQLQTAKESAEFSIGEGWPDDDLTSITAKNVLVLLEERARLLAALKALLAECEVYRAFHPQAGLLVDARNAIAKAEGTDNG